MMKLNISIIDKKATEEAIEQTLGVRLIGFYDNDKWAELDVSDTLIAYHFGRREMMIETHNAKTSK